MTRSRRSIAAGIALVLTLALWAPAPAEADADGFRRAGNVTFDVLLLRPLGLAATVVGTVFFVPAAILTSPGGVGSVELIWQQFVVEPANATFTRPLGEF